MKIVHEFVVTDENGLHARPSASFVKTASEFDADILVETETGKADGKSIMGLMCLIAGQNTKLKVTATGNDAKEAINALGKLYVFNSKSS